MHYALISAFVMLILTACSSKPKDVRVINTLPPIYPDYTDVTVPVNIAPLNFLVRGNVEDVYVEASYGGTTLEADCSGNEAAFDIDDWHELLAQAAGNDIKVKVYVKNGDWTEYKSFSIHVANEEIDPYLTYRLIEPDYEVFSRLQIQERCIEDFSVRTLCDHNMVGNRCMNCHTFGNQDPNLSFLYVRGDGGGMIVNQNGKLSKLIMKTADMVSSSVYAQFSPSGRYLVFSTNVIIPAFHAKASKRLEVFDSKSDIYVADLQANRILRSPLLADSTHLETFPTFSPDGKSIYFCTAPRLIRPDSIADMQYDLCRIAFDEKTGTIGAKVDTIAKAIKGEKSSVCHPRVSPNGRYLLYTVADYGTFPIWHPEADLRMIDLQSGKIDTLPIANSAKSDTYHSWSSDSHWFVFASKRDDGLYGKPYFCYIDKGGKAHKPFVLPQRHPAFYDNCLKSFNIPELGKSKVPFSAHDVSRAMGSEGVMMSAR